MSKKEPRSRWWRLPVGFAALEKPLGSGRRGRLRGGSSAETRDGLILVVVGLENGDETVARQEIPHFRREIQEYQLTPLSGNGCVVVDELSLARAIHVRYANHVQNDAHFPGIGEFRDRFTERIVALADQDLAVQVQDDYVADLARYDLHAILSFCSVKLATAFSAVS